MEEVAPVATSDAALLAPEEIQPKKKREEIGETEKTATDRKRERRLKKKLKRLRSVEKRRCDKVVAKLRPGLGNRYSRKSLEKKLQEGERGREIDKSLRSSSRFFGKLQDQVKEQVKSIKDSSRTNSITRRTPAVQYKL